MFMATNVRLNIRIESELEYPQCEHLPYFGLKPIDS